MPVTYPATMPTTGVTSVSWTNSTASLISRSPFTFQGQAQNWGGQIRFASVTVEDLNRDSAEEWIGFLDSLNGTTGTFLFGDPNANTTLGSGGGSPVANGANQSGDSLAIRGAPNSVSNWLRRGDWIQIGTTTRARLYKVTQNVNTSSTGTATIPVWPNLRMNTIDDEVIYRTYPKGLFRRSNPTYDYTESNDCKYSISFTCEEVI